MSFASDKVAVAILTAAREVAPDRWQQVALDVASGVVFNGGDPVTRCRYYAGHALNLMTDWPKSVIGRAVGSRSTDNFFGNVKMARARSWWDDAIVDRVTQAIFAMPDDATKEITEIPAARDPTGAAEEERLQRIGGLPNATNEPQGATISLNMRATDAPLPRPAVTPAKRSALELLRQAVENTQRMTPPEESR